MKNCTIWLMFGCLSTRFGWNYITALMPGAGTPERSGVSRCAQSDDLVNDFVSMVTRPCQCVRTTSSSISPLTVRPQASQFNLVSKAALLDSTSSAYPFSSP